MRIDGMDAANLAITKAQDSKSEVTKDNRGNPQLEYIAESKNISQITNFDKKDLPVSEKVVIEAIQRANKAILGTNRRFEFSIHEKTKEIMVKVIDSDTNEVIREIPNEKILDMVAKMWEMAGLIVDERR